MLPNLVILAVILFFLVRYLNIRSEYETIFARIWKSFLDFIIIGTTAIAYFISTLKYLCHESSYNEVVLPSLFICAGLFFVVLSLVSIANDSKTKKVLGWVRILYILVWLVLLGEVAFIPAAPGGSC